MGNARTFFFGKWARRKYLLLILVSFLLGALTLSLCYANFQKEAVIKVDEKEEVIIKTWGNTVEDAVNQAEIKLGPEDKVYPSLDEDLDKETKIFIMRAFPVYVTADNKERVVWTTGGNVKEVIDELDIWVGTFDEVDPSLGTMLKPDLEINISRIERDYVVEEHEIPFSVIKRSNQNLERGITRLIREGEPGLREDLVEIVIKDGEEIERKVHSTTVIDEPIEKLMETGENTVLSRSGSDNLRFDRVINVVATAYCPGTVETGCPIDVHGHSQCTGRYNNAVTSSGRAAVAGNGTKDNPHLIAVDPGVIPLGSLVYVDGYGFAYAADRGGAIRGNRIDILKGNHNEALRFGRKELKVYVLK